MTGRYKGHTYGPWPTARKCAKRLGTKTYFTGKSCKNGHTSFRFTSSGHCSVCDKAWDESRAGAPGRAEAKAASSRNSARRRRETDPAFVEKWREYDRIRRLDPAVGERSRLLIREKRKDPAYREREREYKRNHPEQVAAQNHRRRARLREAEGSHSPSDILRIYMLQGRKCASCAVRVSKTTWHVDHIYPLSKGGSNWPSNIQILCAACNQEKHALHPIDFARRKGRLL